MKILEGIRVLDLTHHVAGPFCVLFLADMGADVIKIEAPWGDVSRATPPLVKGSSPHFEHLNRNKRGITLNLKSEKGVEIFRDLVKVSDIVVENFAPGTMEKLHVGYEAVKEVNPQIIFASISGYGQYGPYANRPSYNTIMQAQLGYMDLTRINATYSPGASPDFPPILAPEAPADTTPGLVAVIGILSALLYREKTGEGQRIDVSQMDSMIAAYPSTPIFLNTGYTFQDALRNLRRAHMQALYKTKDGYIAAAGGGRSEDKLLEILDAEELDDTALTEWMASKTNSEVEKIFSEARIPVSPVCSLGEALSHPQIKARETVIEVDHPIVGKFKMPNFPIKFSGITMKVEKLAPKLGEHNNEILSQLLGYTTNEIGKLREDGII